MRSKAMEKLLRLLLVLLGIGIGLAAAQLGLALYRLSHQNTDIHAWVPVAAYAGMGVLGGLVFLLLSNRIVRRVSSISREMQKEFDKMPVNQLLSAVIGLILGLILGRSLCPMGGLIWVCRAACCGRPATSAPPPPKATETITHGGKSEPRQPITGVHTPTAPPTTS